MESKEKNTEAIHRPLTLDEIRAYGITVNRSTGANDILTNGATASIATTPIDIDQEISQVKAILDVPRKDAASQATSKSRRSFADMQTRSTHGTASRNFRQKTTVDKKWQATAMAVIIVASMAVGGYLASPVENAIDYIANWGKLKNMTTDFQDDVVNRYTSTTFTQDQSLDYEKIAAAIEADGNFSNAELLVAVDTLGEVNANRVLAAAKNPPDDNVEDYMRDHNITNMRDWKNKTIKAMGIEQEIASNQKDLESMLGAKSDDKGAEHSNTDSTTYGGK